MSDRKFFPNRQLAAACAFCCRFPLFPLAGSDGMDGKYRPSQPAAAKPGDSAI